MTDEFREEVVKMINTAVKKCFMTDGIRYVVVMSDDENFRVKATRRLAHTDDKEFYGEILVTIGQPNYRERERIERMKKHGKLPKSFFGVIGRNVRKKEDYFY